MLHRICSFASLGLLTMACSGSDPDVCAPPSAVALGQRRSASATVQVSNAAWDGVSPRFAHVANQQPAGRDVALSSRPYALAINGSGVVYAPRLDAASAARFDLPAITPTGHVPVGTIPTDVSFDRTGNRAFVSNQGGSVSVIDVASNSVTRTIPVRDRAFVSLISPNDNLLYIGSAIGKVYVYDLGGERYTDSVTVGDVPQHLAFHPDGVRLYVSMRDDGRVVEVDTRTNDIVRSFVSTPGVQEAVVAPDGCELYVANQSGWLEVWDLGTGAQTAEVALGDGPWALTLSPDRSKLYAGILFSGEVAVINRATRVVEQYLDVGGIPRRIKFAPDNTTIVIANEAGYVTFIP